MKQMPGKWYQSRQNQAAIISGVFLLITAVLTSPLWLKNSEKVEPENGAQIKTESSTPITLKVIFDLEPQKTDSVISSLRKEYQLRELEPLESGKTIKETSSGTFFNLSAIYLDRYKDFVENVLSRGGISIQKYLSDDFEIFKVTEDQIFIVAFLSNERASSISRLNGLSKQEIILSPISWNDLNCLVLLPIDRVLAARCREITTDDKKSFHILDAAIQ